MVSDDVGDFQLVGTSYENRQKGSPSNSSDAMFTEVLKLGGAILVVPIIYSQT